MIPIVPENGYESPLPSPRGGHEFFAQPKLRKGERLRVAYTRESVEASIEGQRTNCQANTVVGTIDGGEERNENSESDEEIQRTVGLRDRIGCYTWTWFTMTMATGGIANVLHSSVYESET
jgi:hypothetical protein